MRFLYGDPYALRGAVEQLLDQPIATRRERDQPIPVDVYQVGKEIIIEGALPGGRLEQLEISCEAGLLTIKAQVPEADRDFAVREIQRGSLSRTLALPGECDVEQAHASFENGILRIVIPRARQRVAHTIQVEIAKEKADPSRIVMERPQVVEAVKGEGYREVPARSNKKKSRSK